MTTDPIADLLTRIRNAQLASHKKVSVPYSSVKESIVKLMIKNKYLKDYKLEGKKSRSKNRGSSVKPGPHLNLMIRLRYKAKIGVLTSLTRISKPGIRVYANTKELPKLMRGRGILILSTSKGLMTGKDALDKKLGGELILKIT